MNKHEIRRLIRKLSRRRHRHLRHMIYYMRWPATYRDDLARDKRAIASLTSEIDALLLKL